MMFGRKKKGAEDASDLPSPDATNEGVDGATGQEAGETSSQRASGPRDRSEVSGLEGRIDLGALQVTGVAGMELRLEVDADQEVTAAVVAVEDSLVQLQAFAAPRSTGLWDEIRDEIEEMITGNGGTADIVQGPFGTELHTRLPQAGSDGRTVFAPAVFAGVDGPRWLLRAVYSGPAAIDPGAREVLDEAVRGLVVVRGEDPRAPREMLPLVMPSADRIAAETSDETDEEGDDLRPFERGPEITEVR